jgi:hypothetical protein
VETPTGETVPVPGTNNEAERSLRHSATARDTGRSCFTKLLTTLRTAPPSHSVLDRLFPEPSG